MSNSIPISVIILTKNEAAGIATTIAHVAEFDQVIVVDSNSKDDTANIARSLGAGVVNFTWDGKYPKKKQWALENSGVRNEWVLLLDADEYPSRELKQELRAVLPSLTDSDVNACEIRLSYKFSGRFLKHGHRVTKRSLLRIGAAKFPEVNDLGAPGIREVEGHYQPEASGEIKVLSNRLMHDDVDPVSSWFERHNRYSDWEAHLRLDNAMRQGVASKRSRQGQLFDKVPFKPAAFFVYSFFARLGFLDGRAGLDYAIALSTYYWQIEVKTRELKRKGTRGSQAAQA